jgi:hypothetical protein
MMVYNVPDAPEGLTWETSTVDSITISWAANVGLATGGVPITDYKVYWDAG